MSHKQLDPVQKRNRILLAGVVVVLISILMGRSVPWLFVPAITLIWMGSAAALGFILAGGVTHLGTIFLSSPIEPWYARPGAMPFTVVFLGLTFAAWVLIRRMQGCESAPTSIDITCFVSVLGSTLIFIVLLQWVSYDE
jgi:hypothetical protein